MLTKQRQGDGKRGLPTHLETDCLEQKTGVSDTILKQGKSDKDMFLIENTCGHLKLIPLQGSSCESRRYSKVRSLFEHVKRTDNIYMIILSVRCL